MSIASGLLVQSEKSGRRVRFSLPEAKLNLTADNSKYRLHGTKNYINGTLINVSNATLTPTGLKVSTENKSVIKLSDMGKQNSKTELKSSLKNGNLPKDSQYKMSINLRPTTVSTVNSHARHSLPKTNSISSAANKKKFSKSRTRSEKSFKMLPNIEKKFSSLEDLYDDTINGKTGDLKTNLNRYKSTEDVRDPSNFKVSKNGNGNGNGNIPKLPATTTRIVIETAAIDDNNARWDEVFSVVMTSGSNPKKPQFSIKIKPTSKTNQKPLNKNFQKILLHNAKSTSNSSSAGTKCNKARKPIQRLSESQFKSTLLEIYG